VNNDPVKYADPSGHYRVEGPGSKIGCSDPHYCQGEQPSKRNNTGTSPSCIFCPDAHYVSLNLTAGFIPWYGSWSFDIVMTEREIGVFSVGSRGPGFGQNEIPDTIRQEKMDASLVSPQIGATLLEGALWGDVLREVGVKAYQGSSEIFGGGISPESLLGGLGGAGEYFRSVDRWSGEPNGEIRGVGGGITAGAPVVAVQHIYAEARYQSELSYIATSIGRWLYILH
jgi:hypothetical protein